MEILSPEDTPSETLEKFREYLAFGVPRVWVIDPVTRNGQIHNAADVQSVHDAIFTTDRLRVDLADANV